MTMARDTNPDAKEKNPYTHTQFSAVIINSLAIKMVTLYQMFKTFSA